MSEKSLGNIKPLNLTPEKTEAELESQIPKPVGYHVLVAMPKVENTYGDSDLIKSAKTMHHESILSMVGIVLDMGDLAYCDKEKFPTGKWCNAGDYVMFRMNSGTRFKVDGQEYRLMNDDSIEAVVIDPNAITNV